MKWKWIGLCFLVVQLAAGAARGQQIPQAPVAPANAAAATNPAPADDAERRDLVTAMQQAAGSRIDYVRALEAHLKKYPNSPYKDKIVRSLFQAAKELKDQQRIALYGEQLLAQDPDDVSVMWPVGMALNSFDDPKAAQRALAIGECFETDVRNRSSASTANAVNTRQRLDEARALGLALLIQADAEGILGRTAEAIQKAKESFAEFPSAEAARSLGRWQTAAGHYDTAVRAYADAFALEDSAEHHADDRRQLSELYLKIHKSTTGLGDIVLAEYDRMIALQQKLDPQNGVAGSTELGNARLLTLDGTAVPLRSFQGKVVVMDFWATWCRPCRIQHPLFEQVKQSFQNDPRVVFLEVDSGEDRNTVAPFLQKQSWNSDVYLDNGLMTTLGIENIPATVLLGRDSKVYSELIGFRPETFVALLTSRIQQALASNDAAQQTRSQVN